MYGVRFGIQRQMLLGKEKSCSMILVPMNACTILGWNGLASGLVHPSSYPGTFPCLPHQLTCTCNAMFPGHVGFCMPYLSAFVSSLRADGMAQAMLEVECCNIANSSTAPILSGIPTDAVTLLCSFDILRDDLGPSRTQFPHTMYAVAGSQAAAAKSNVITLFKLASISGKRPSQNDESSSSEDDDMSDDEEGQPRLSTRQIAHHGAINRIRSMPQQPSIAATWSEAGHVQVLMPLQAIERMLSLFHKLVLR